MRILLLITLLSTSAFAGTCKIKAQLWAPAPIILLEKYKVNLNDATLEECVQEAKETLNHTEKVSVPICGSGMYGSCGTIEVIAKIKKAKFKFTTNDHVIKGNVKKKRTKKDRKAQDDQK